MRTVQFWLFFLKNQRDIKCLDTIAMKILSPKIWINEIFSLLFFVNLSAQTGAPASKTLWIRHWSLWKCFILLFLTSILQKVLVWENFSSWIMNQKVVNKRHCLIFQVWYLCFFQLFFVLWYNTMILKVQKNCQKTFFTHCL